MQRVLYFILSIVILSSSFETIYAQSTSTSQDSDSELGNAFRNAKGDTAKLILNLEEYLKKYPKSENRETIEVQIYKLSAKSGDNSRALSYLEKFIKEDRASVDYFLEAISLLRKRHESNDLEQALKYSNKLVSLVSGALSSPKPRRLSAAQWDDRKNKGLASVYWVRSEVYTDLNKVDKARTDLLKSYKLWQFAPATLTLAELEEKQNFKDQALEYYIRALALAMVDDNQSIQKKAKEKINQLYIAKHGSDKGLGDITLKTYEIIKKEREEYVAKLDKANKENDEINDPLKFKLTRLDGSKLDMNSLRGKVIVLNFWATWCGPCRKELPFFARLIEEYKDDSDVELLAVSTDEDRDAVPPFAKRMKLNLNIVYADDLNHLFEVRSIPTTIILDKAGKIIFRESGFGSGSDYMAEVSNTVDKAKK